MNQVIIEHLKKIIDELEKQDEMVRAEKLVERILRDAEELGFAPPRKSKGYRYFKRFVFEYKGAETISFEPNHARTARELGAPGLYHDGYLDAVSAHVLVNYWNTGIFKRASECNCKISVAYWLEEA